MLLRRCAPLAAAGLLGLASVGGLPAHAADVGAVKTDLWSGLYLGAQVGGLDATGSSTELCDASEGFGRFCSGNVDGLDIGDNTASGATLGAYLGFNHTIDHVLVGLEGDLNWDNANGRNRLGEFSYDSGVNWDASIRARLGLLVGERGLLYVTGGPSWINAELESKAYCATTFSFAVDCGESGTEFGWQIGAGAEFLLTDRLSLKAEYLHGWYGDANLDLARGEIFGITETSYLKQSLQTNVVRGGIAFHFGGL